MIIFWIPMGGMGNLIFQYQAMIRFCPNARHFIMPYSQLAELLELDSRCIQLNFPKRYRARYIGYWARVLNWLAKVGILGLIEPEVTFIDGKYISETSELTYRRGLLNSVVFRGFFQSREQAVNLPNLLSQNRLNAQNLLNKFPSGPKVAIHLRFGDYSEWSVLGKRGLILPLSYYHAAIKIISNHVKNPCFLVFSDDIELANELLRDFRGLHYFRGSNPIEDLSVMSMCSHAIISASTFAWWGAVFIKNSCKIVIAPKFWLGFKSNRWFPSTMNDPYLTYIDLTQVTK
jgi:hypothetical protein